MLICDLGYTNFTVFAHLVAAHMTWLTRAKSNLAYEVERHYLTSELDTARLPSPRR